MKTKEESRVVIRFATENDIPAVMKFIDTYWKKGHILGNNETLFRYEWCQNGNVTVALALDGEDIVGMEGYIPYGKKNRDVMMTLWKVIKTGYPLLGMSILDYIRNNADAKTISSPGINVKTIELYKYLGFKTGKMKQWYRLNPHIKNYQIAVVNNYNIPKVSINSMLNLVEIKNFAELENCFSFNAYYKSKPRPLKEDWYIEHRYFNHPIYIYSLYGICDKTDNVCRTVLVFRVQKMYERRVLRLVDVIGDTDLLYSVTMQIDELIQQGKFEYVDFYEFGMDEKFMEKAGWQKVMTSGNIIPNYFAPFVQDNIDILCYTSDPDIKLFKADGDQDRPN